MAGAQQDLDKAVNQYLKRKGYENIKRIHSSGSFGTMYRAKKGNETYMFKLYTTYLDKIVPKIRETYQSGITSQIEGLMPFAIESDWRYNHVSLLLRSRYCVFGDLERQGLENVRDNFSRWANRIYNIMYACHDRGWFHNDIKPANIVICGRQGVPYIVDDDMLHHFDMEEGTRWSIGITTPTITPESYVYREFPRGTVVTTQNRGLWNASRWYIDTTQFALVIFWMIDVGSGTNEYANISNSIFTNRGVSQDLFVLLGQIYTLWHSNDLAFNAVWQPYYVWAVAVLNTPTTREYLHTLWQNIERPRRRGFRQLVRQPDPLNRRRERTRADYENRRGGYMPRYEEHVRGRGRAPPGGPPRGRRQNRTRADYENRRGGHMPNYEEYARGRGRASSDEPPYEGLESDDDVPQRQRQHRTILDRAQRG